MSKRGRRNQPPERLPPTHSKNRVLSFTRWPSDPAKRQSIGESWDEFFNLLHDKIGGVDDEFLESIGWSPESTRRFWNRAINARHGLDSLN